MRELRLTLYFVIGLLLGSWGVLAFAETTPVTQVAKYRSLNNNYDTPDLAGQAYCAFKNAPFVSINPQGGTPPSSYGVTCQYSWGPVRDSSVIELKYIYSCPDSSWSFYYGGAGVPQYCTRPDCPPGKEHHPVTGQCVDPCVAPNVRNPSTGVCEPPACPPYGTNFSSGLFHMGTSPSQTFPGYACTPGGCGVIFSGDQPAATAMINGVKHYYARGTFDSAGADSHCTPGADNALPSSGPALNDSGSHAPPCNPGEGVISSGGTVLCVPGGANPDLEKPKVSESKSVETKPDGSQIITTTTQTCTGDGACTTTTTTQITNNSSGQPGHAGTPGTSQKVTDKPSTDQSEFCAKNPTSPLCKGDIATEGTLKKVQDDLSSLANPKYGDDSTLKAAKHSDESNQANLDENEKLRKYGVGEIDPTTSERSAWESALSSGFWTPIPHSNCQPIVSTIGGRRFELDPCPTAAKISSIGSYALWIMFIVGVFVMLTGGKKEV